MSRKEVLKYRKTFTQVGLDRELDDLARGVRHESTDTSHLHDLLLASTRSRVSHDTYRVLFGEVAEHGTLDLFSLVLPNLDYLEITIVVGQKPIIIERIDFTHSPIGIVQDVLPFWRDLHV